jgi:hypothetical protein
MGNVNRKAKLKFIRIPNGGGSLFSVRANGALVAGHMPLRFLLPMSHPPAF